MKNDIETLVEAWIQRTVDYHNDSDKRLKYACITAAQVVGSYSGATQTIAKQTKRSVSSVENWAHAFRLYSDLRKNGNRIRVRTLFRTLPASHWWLAYDIQQSGYDALYYLENANLHHWSGRDMLKEFAREREAGNAPLIFKQACRTMFGLASELLKQAARLTEAQHNAILNVIESFDG